MTTITDPTRSAEPRDDFISLSEIMRMVLKHRRQIAVFVLLVTVASAVFFALAPRQYKAEGFLQVIPPITAIEEKIDQLAFETIIVSHLQTIQSAYMAKEVASTLNAGGFNITPEKLNKKVKIIRPPKSSLIVLTATFPAPDQAVTVAGTWIKKYLASMRKNNINVLLCQTRMMLKKAQIKLMESQARASQLKASTDQAKPVVDLARGIDDNQLWRELGDSAPAEKLKNLSKIHVKDQEQSDEYLALKTMFYDAEREFAAAAANRDFFQDVEGYLEYKIHQLENPSAPSAVQSSSNAMQFAETMLKATDIVETGEPALKSSSRGAMRKTALVFFASLCLASLCACLAEWFKTIKV